MKPYSEYKPTGLAWLPEIPKHWKLVRGKNLFKKVNRPVEEGSEVITCFRDGEVTLRKNRRATGFTESLKEIGYQGIKKGDLVIHVMDAFAGAIGVSDSDGKGTPVYNVCIARAPDTTNNYYFAYIVRVMAQTGYIQSLYRGIRERSSDFRFEVFANQTLPFPPADEQAQIVRYLDAMTAKINKLIRAKKRQIALLQEQKQAIITQAVTRGLDPDVELKDSGIDWLGPIPKHWTQNKVGHFYKSVLGKMLASTPSSNNDSYEKYLCAKDVHFSGIDLSDLKQMWFSPEEKKKYMLQKGDLLIVEGGAGAGGSAVFNGYEEPVYIQNSIHLLRPQNSKNVVKFLYYWLYSLIGRKYIDFACNKATIPHYTGDKLFETPFLFIPLEEQKQIVAFLDNACEKYNKAISNLNDEISHITEYKNSLNSSVVTGQVDVRNIAVEKVDPADLIAETDDDPTGEESLEESEE